MQTANTERGNVLIIALVFLLLLTVAGVASMRLASNDTRIADAMLERERAFQAAEAALIDAEESLASFNLSSRNLPSNGDECLDTPCYNASCTDGFCFNGNFSANNSTPQSYECSFNNNALTEEQWQKASSYAIGEAQALVLVEFLCYQIQPGMDAATANALPPPSAAWAPVFRVSTRASGVDSSTRVQLQSQLLQSSTGRVPGIFSVNEYVIDRNNTIDSISGITSNFCIFNCDMSLPFDKQNPLEKPIYDWNQTSGVVTGGGFLSQCPASPPADACADRVIDGETKHVDIRTPSAATGAGVHGLVGNSKIGANTSAILSKDRYFQQYFGTQDREAVYQHSKSESMSFADFNSGTDIQAGTQILVVEVEENTVDWSGTAPAGLKDVVVIIKDARSEAAKADGPFSFKVEANKDLPASGLFYVEGDLDYYGSQTQETTLAVEGNAYLNTSLRLNPQVNAADLISSIGLGRTRGRTSWQQL